MPFCWFCNDAAHNGFQIDCFFIAVELVMRKVPVKMMASELDIRPYTPLLQGEGLIESLDIRYLPKDLTEDLLTMHAEAAFRQTEISSAEYKCM